MTPSRRDTALALAEELLADIELSRIPPPDFAKKASRLARLLDDLEALEWLSFELTGYPTPLTLSASEAARRSGRYAGKNEETGDPQFWTASLNKLQADVDAGKIQLQAAADAPVSISSANPNQFVSGPVGNSHERGRLRNFVAEQEALAGKVVGSIYSYVSEREIELRFGNAVEGAFSAVRDAVDAKIARLVPGAATKLAAAFENAASGNPEHWANAASACRRLLKAVADELRPPGEPVQGRLMTDDKYINRLIDWITNQKATGSTLKDVVAADLEDFGKRIDAFDGAGHKGAHAEVTRYEASRFITGAYLLIGDILNLLPEVDPEGTEEIVPLTEDSATK